MPLCWMSWRPILKVLTRCPCAPGMGEKIYVCKGVKLQPRILASCCTCPLNWFTNTEHLNKVIIISKLKLFTKNSESDGNIQLFDDFNFNDASTDRLADWLTDGLADRWTERQTVRLTDCQTDRRSDWQTVRRTDKKEGQAVKIEPFQIKIILIVSCSSLALNSPGISVCFIWVKLQYTVLIFVQICPRPRNILFISIPTAAN